jgi:hypothetical protein
MFDELFDNSGTLLVDSVNDTGEACITGLNDFGRSYPRIGNNPKTIRKFSSVIDTVDA